MRKFTKIQICVLILLLIQPILHAQTNLISHWTFDDAKGSNLTDSIGTSAGTLMNGPTWSTGLVNLALSFDGTDDYISVADSDQWDFKEKPVTISMWIKASPGQHEPYAKILDHKLKDAGWHIALNAKQQIKFFHEANTDKVQITSPRVLTDDKWHHIVVTLNGSPTGQAFLYIDDALVGTDEYDELKDADKPLLIGGNREQNNFTGLIDNIQIFQSTATEAEVSNLYSASFRNFYPHIDDADNKPIAVASPSAPPEIKAIDTLGFPRLILTMSENWSFTNEELAKYHLISAKGNNLYRTKQIQEIKPHLLVLRQFSPRAYQDYIGKGGGSIPFESTGPVTDGRGSMFAGHWLYEKGSTTTQAITADSTSVTVDSPNDIPKENFVVIYDKGSNFENAEFCKITNKKGNTLTITRGHKSRKSPHSAGSLIKPHVLGQGFHRELWSYNHARTCSKDANGKQLNEFMAEWLVKYANCDHTLNPVDGLRIDGVLFDADTYFMWKNADVNNDGVKDNGLLNEANEWAIGLNRFYNLLRASNEFKDKLIVGGYHDTRGFEGLSGIQMETFPNGGNMERKPTSVTPADYTQINTQMSKYIFNVHYSQNGPAYVENLNKTPTLLFPQNGVADSNAPNRVALTLSLMDNGFYGRKAVGRNKPDPWYDEFAVNIKNPNGENFGHAIPHEDRNDTSKIRKHVGWLGQPLGQYFRIPQKENEFEKEKTLVTNGHFNIGIKGWQCNPQNIISQESREGYSYEGQGSLLVSVPFKETTKQVRIKSQSIPFVDGEEYTISFMARAKSIRGLHLGLDGQMQRESILLAKDWRRYIYSFTKKGSNSKRFIFEAGKEKIDFWIDDFYVFKGNANLFQRDFENGVAIANATPLTRNIKLRGNFMKIKGNQDPLNNGDIVSNETIKIDPFDGIVLVRLDP